MLFHFPVMPRKALKRRARPAGHPRGAIATLSRAHHPYSQSRAISARIVASVVSVACVPFPQLPIAPMRPDALCNQPFMHLTKTKREKGTEP